MNLKYHKTLTIEKWLKFPFEKQIWMIANELNRAKNWIIKNDTKEVKSCYERAFELLYLTIAGIKDRNKLREFTRFKEVLAWQYIQEKPQLKDNNMLLKVLLLLDRRSYMPELL